MAENFVVLKLETMFVKSRVWGIVNCNKSVSCVWLAVPRQNCREIALLLQTSFVNDFYTETPEIPTSALLKYSPSLSPLPKKRGSTSPQAGLSEGANTVRTA